MVITVLLGLILISLWVVLYQLVKQQGRMLLRLDGLERRVGHASQDQAQPSGLPVGTSIPSFRLPNLKGQEIGLEDFRGKRVLLIHWSPGCGYCVRIATDLARLQAEFHQRKVELLLVSTGDAESNRELAEKHGLECPILLQKDDSQVLDAFRGLGTPVAYLLDEQGRVAQPLAVGAKKVPELAREAIAQPKNKRLPRERRLKVDGKRNMTDQHFHSVHRAFPSRTNGLWEGWQFCYLVRGGEPCDRSSE